METDSSYQVFDCSNINGKRLLLHHTRNEDFCHFKITPSITNWTLVINNFGIYSQRTLLFFALVLGGLLKLPSCEVNKFHICIILAAFLGYLYLHYYYVAEENVLCIKKIGVQISTIYATGRTLQEFIPQKFIADCLINEVIYSQSIIYVLILLVSKTDDSSNYSDNRYAKIKRIVTLFKGTLPRLKTLELVKREAHRVLLDEADNCNEECGN